MTQHSTSKVFDLFPTPLYVNTYIGDTTRVVEYFNSQPMNPAVGGGYGEISQNTYVLDNPVCNELSNWIMGCMEEYAKDVMCYSFEELQFAQSWLTYKQPGQFHKAHTHPNTIIAGVFYYELFEGAPAICFSKNVGSSNRSYIEPSLNLETYKNSRYSQEEVYFTPSLNNLIIFPSYLTHGVPPNTTGKVRKALGVNALTKGKLGDRETISEIFYSRYA